MTINYSGQIKITINNKISIIHNAGLEKLFTYLCTCLVGQFSTSSSPTYIDLGESSTADGTYQTILHDFIRIDNKSISEITVSTVTYQCAQLQVTITQSNLLENFNNAKYYKLFLCNENKQRMAEAYVNEVADTPSPGPGALSGITATNPATITWSLYFSN